MTSQKMWNVNNLLKARELIPIRKNLEIENALEDSFVQGQLLQEDIPLPPNVSSTIAIAVSCNGRTFATTHGDHTVKIFNFYSNKPYRIFHGHPRTPWTVKYHPTNPNIVASGCLGYQVRVWDIEQDRQLILKNFEFSIISLSFHPDGDYLAVASGSKLEVWKWSNSNNSSSAAPPLAENNMITCPIVHSRNIRAVCFHPSGEFILAAAPDKPKQATESLIYCNLYAVPFSSIFININAYTQPKELLSYPIVLPQIHLYSDGGFDISRDGNYFVTCARLYEDQDVRRWLPNPFSFSPHSTTERIDEEEAMVVPTALPPAVPIRLEWDNLSLRGNNAPSTLPSFNQRSLLASSHAAASNPFLQQGPATSTAPIAVPPLQYRPTFNYQSQIEMNPVPFPPQPPLSSFTLQGNLNNGGFMLPSTNERSTGQNNTRRQLFSSPDFKTPTQNKQQANPIRIETALFRDDSNSSNTNSSHQLSLDEMLMTSSMDECDPPTASTTSSNPQSKHRASVEKVQEFPIRSLKSIQPNTRLPHTRRLKATISKNPNSLSGMRYDDYVCIFKFEYNELLQTLTPVLLNARHLQGKLMKAITSTKLSPTGRYVLIGYGVRSTEGIVEDHKQRDAACEIIDIQDPSLQTKAVMCDRDDEVNIAQFHPLPGHGVVYGTKRGKIRTFARAIA